MSDLTIEVSAQRFQEAMDRAAVVLQDAAVRLDAFAAAFHEVFEKQRRLSRMHTAYHAKTRRRNRR